MIGYVSVGTNDWKKGLEFYDKLMSAMHAKRVMDYDTFVAWKRPSGGPGFALAQPHNKKAATVGNGTMVAFEVGKTGEVDALYMLVLSLGGTDEGKPGDRGDGYYGAYCRDLDGNKLNFHCWT